MKLRPLRRFLHRLALAMGCTVEELLPRLTTRSLAEWMAFDRLEPFSPRGAWERAGEIVAAVLNAGLKPKKAVVRSDVFECLREHRRPRKATDPVPDYEAGARVLARARGLAFA